MNFTESSVLNVRPSYNRLVDDDGARRPGFALQLAHRHPENQPMTTAMRSGLQRSAVSAISASMSGSRVTVSRANADANARTSSGAGCASGHCRPKNVSAASPTSFFPISH